MQRQYPYSFSYVEWTSKFDKNGRWIQGDPMIRRRTTRCFMVGPDRTRKGELVIKSRNSWDDEAVTQFKLEEPTAKTKNLDSNTYFWNCMRFGAALALVEELEGGDAAYDHEKNLVKLLPVPEYGQERIDYFEIIEKAAPSLKLKRVKVGW